MARLGGWNTITLRWMHLFFVLDIRDQFIIAGEPAGSLRNCDVLTIHRCGADARSLPHGPSRIPDMRPAALPDEAPF